MARVSPPRKVEPATLPAHIGGLNLIFFCLIVADLGALGGLAGQATGAANAGILAPMIGVFLGVVYGCFPLQFLDGRAMIALAGYRILLWALLVLHIPLVVILCLDFSARMDGATASLFLTAPVSILATPGLYTIWTALRSMRWLDPAAPPESWERMPGIDGAAPTAATPMIVALLLPFAAAWRARQTGLAACAALLWLGSFALAPFAPWRAALAFFLAAAIGSRLAGSGRKPPTAAPSDAERKRLLRDIFSPARLTPAPRFAAAGLLCLPCLFILDFNAASAFIALQNSGGLTNFLAALETDDFALLLLLALIFVPAMFFLPFGTDAAKFVFRAAALALALAEIALAVFYAAISFHIVLAGQQIFVPAPVYAIFWPITLSLLAGLSLAGITLVSVATYGRVTDMVHA